MRSPSSQDPLVALWQSSPLPETSSLVQHLRRVQNRHRRLNQIVLAVLCGASLLLIHDAIMERTATHISLCLLWNASLLLGFAWYRLAGCDHVDAITEDTTSLLKFMLARARRDLRIAQALYAGAPFGALVGFMIASVTGFGVSPGEIGVWWNTHRARISGAIAALIIMMVVGLIAARDRRLQIQELRESLKSIQDDA